MDGEVTWRSTWKVATKRYEKRETRYAVVVDPQNATEKLYTNIIYISTIHII